MIRVTTTDLDSGKSESVEIDNTYVLVTAGTAYRDGLQQYANGTHVVTVKGVKG